MKHAGLKDKRLRFMNYSVHNLDYIGWNSGRVKLILSSQVVSLPLEVANFCAAMDTLVDQDGLNLGS